MSEPTHTPEDFALAGELTSSLGDLAYHAERVNSMRRELIETRSKLIDMNGRFREMMSAPLEKWNEQFVEQLRETMRAHAKKEIELGNEKLIEAEALDRVNHTMKRIRERLNG